MIPKRLRKNKLQKGYIIF